MYDIIMIIRNNSIKKKTNIWHKMRITFPAVNRYLKVISDNGLIVLSDKGYKVTPKGLKYCESFEFIRELIEK